MERWRLATYTAAFVLMLGAGAVLVYEGHDLLGSIGVLWFSIALSMAAILAAAVSVLLPRR
jgi:hypothetical protein